MWYYIIPAIRRFGWLTEIIYFFAYYSFLLSLNLLLFSLILASMMVPFFKLGMKNKSHQIVWLINSSAILRLGRKIPNLNQIIPPRLLARILQTNNPGISDLWVLKQQNPENFFKIMELSATERSQTTEDYFHKIALYLFLFGCYPLLLSYLLNRYIFPSDYLSSGFINTSLSILHIISYEEMVYFQSASMWRRSIEGDEEDVPGPVVSTLKIDCYHFFISGFIFVYILPFVISMLK